MTPEDLFVTEWALDFNVRLTATQHMGLQQAIRRSTQAADAANGPRALFVDVDAIARSCNGEFDESGGMYFSRKMWGYFVSEIRTLLAATGAKP